MHGLRKERCRASDCEGSELGDRYAQVCAKGGDDGALAAVPAVLFTASTVSAATGTPTAGAVVATSTTGAAAPRSGRLARGY